MAFNPLKIQAMKKPQKTEKNGPLSLIELSKRTRLSVLEMIYKAQSSHIGSNFSCVDIMAVLYGSVMNIQEHLPDHRDRFVLSKGWAAAANYSLLKEIGVLSEEELKTYGDLEGKLLGLVERSVRGIEASTGSMGHGLPIGLGMALGAKRAGKAWRTYVLMSDGEMDCGTTWESALLAAQHKLDNLFVIVDVNGFQAMGLTDDILSLNSLSEKWTAFGWEVRNVDGHDHEEIRQALTRPTPYERPLVILADTVKGKGVSFMENNNTYHYKNLSVEEYEKAKLELA